MKQTLLYTLAGIVLLASCSDFEADHSALSNREISFKVKTNENVQVNAVSRVTPITDDNITNFGVSVYRRAPDVNISTVVPNFLYDAEVVKTDNKWATVDRQFWPVNSDVLDFFAYAPYHAEGITLSSASATGVPTITYDATRQLDFITATATNQAMTVAGSGVPLTFNHALTTLKFVKSNEMPGNIQSIAIKRVYNMGKLTIGSGWSFTNISRSDTSVALNSSITMIPQHFSDSEQMVEVVYDYMGNIYTLRHLLSGSSWTAGSTITYEITSTALLTIKYDNDVVVTPWDNPEEIAKVMMKQGENTINIGDFLCSDGSVVAPSNIGNKTPVAIVFSLVTSPTDQAHGWTHGYAMALKNVHNDNGESIFFKWALNEGDVPGIPNLTGYWRNFASDMDGYTNTTYLNSSDYPAGYAARTTYASQVAPPANTSGWFLPSSGQWFYIFYNLFEIQEDPHIYWGWYNYKNNDAGIIAVNQKLSVVGEGNYDAFEYINNPYWGSSEYTSAIACSASYYPYNDICYIIFASPTDKKTVKSFRIRPCIAF